MVQFSTWLRRQTDRRDPVGTLAHTVTANPCCRQARGHDTLRIHLRIRHHWTPLLLTLDQAVREWRSQTP